MRRWAPGAGYNYYGTETLYSGVSGRMMEAEIFMGVVYYQRLRHMVSDKYQVILLQPPSLHPIVTASVCGSCWPARY